MSWNQHERRGFADAQRRQPFGFVGAQEPLGEPAPGKRAGATHLRQSGQLAGALVRLCLILGVLVAQTGSSWAGGSRRSSSEDLLRALGQALEVGIADQAAVPEVDFSIVPSFILRTYDHRLFQVRDLSILSPDKLLQVSAYLAAADRLDFSRHGDRWKIWISYGRIGPGLLNAVVRNYLQDQEPSCTAHIDGMTGTTLDGRSWGIRMSQTPITTIFILRPPRGEPTASSEAGPGPEHHPSAESASESSADKDDSQRWRGRRTSQVAEQPPQAQTSFDSGLGDDKDTQDQVEETPGGSERTQQGAEGGSGSADSGSSIAAATKAEEARNTGRVVERSATLLRIDLGIANGLAEGMVVEFYREGRRIGEGVVVDLSPTGGDIEVTGLAGASEIELGDFVVPVR